MSADDRGSRGMKLTFGTETIAGVVSAHPIYSPNGWLVGLVEGPASSGRKTWRVVLHGRRVGDFKTAELAKAAAEETSRLG